MLELIVVVAIIALLAALLLPALSRAKAQAARTVCISNSRQLALASSMYVSDNGDWLPYPNLTMGGDLPFGSGWLYSPASRMPPILWLEPYESTPALAYRTGLFYGYMPNPKAFLCPLDAQSKYFALRPNQMSSYKMNAAVCGFPTPLQYRSCKITDIWSPMCWIMWEEDENLGNPAPRQVAYFDGASWPELRPSCPWPGPGYRHGKGGVVQAIDGHVRLVPYREFRAEQTNSSKGLIWWSPWSVNGR